MNTRQTEQPWVDYQPRRQREKCCHNIRLRDGSVVPRAYPNGESWTDLNTGRVYKDYRVVAIQKSPEWWDTEEIICPGCGWVIDPEVCHCGDLIKSHDPYYCGHSPVPAGCTCGYADADQRKAPGHK